jgi:hypothetical protein
MPNPLPRAPRAAVAVVDWACLSVTALALTMMALQVHGTPPGHPERVIAAATPGP